MTKSSKLNARWQSLKNRKGGNIGRKVDGEKGGGEDTLKLQWLDNMGGRDEADLKDDHIGEYVWMTGGGMRRREVKVYLPSLDKLKKLYSKPLKVALN